ncbi:uncharacterized protein LOC135846779 [Planococcus citri]|uniref:uncharacterized protein LOC135846779 n=1 Tax=Planococcus citri TaxID=170843 RepID=UPI0031F9775A
MMIICKNFVIFSLFFTILDKSKAAETKKTGTKEPYVLAEIDDEKSPTGHRYEFPSCVVTQPNQENGDIKFSASGESVEILYLCYPMEIYDCVNAGSNRFMNHYCAFNEKPNCGVEGNYDYVMKNVLNKYSYEMTCAKTHHNAKLYRVGYDFQFIPGEPIVKDVYNFCYNKEKQKTLYVEYKIMSPDLLNNSQVNDKTYHKKIEMISFDRKEFGDFEKKIAYFQKAEKNSNYQFWGYNLVVPPQHMAFEYWKEPLFHIVNTQLLRSTFHSEMNIINNYIRDKAIEVYGEIFIRAGVFDFADDIFDSSIWWKLIYNESREYAIALFIHNELTPPYMKLCDNELELSCLHYGWQDLAPSTISKFVYCCTPDYLIDMYGFPAVKTFNLNNPPPENPTYAGKKKNCKVPKKNYSQSDRTARRKKIDDFLSNNVSVAVN